MLAYSSVENIGIITLGIGLGLLGRATHQPVLAVLGFGGALLHVLNHALFKGLLFLSAGAVLHGSGIDDLERLGGIARRDPWNAGLFAFGGAAICGPPPLNGFVSEFLIYSGFLRGAGFNSVLVTAVSLLGLTALALIGGLALTAFTKLFGVMFLGEPRDANVELHSTPNSMLAGVTILAAACVAVVALAPFVGGLLQVPLGTLAGDTLASRAFPDWVENPLASVSAASLAALGIAGALIALRRRLRSPDLAVERQVTWGCGFAQPTARIQYTGSSYVANLANAFRSLLRTQRHLTRPNSCFAAQSGLETQTADAAVRLGFEPTFRAIARGCARLWPLQHGRIQLFLVYLIAALLLVFAVEAWLSPFRTRESGAATVQQAIENPLRGGNRVP